VGWAVAGLMAILLVGMLITPMGQTAVAGFMAVFNLGRTEVRITPVDTPTAPLSTVVAQGSIVERGLTLAEAQEVASFAIPRPAYIPAGYDLQGVNSYSFPDLPAWVPQPFFVELVYRSDAEQAFTLRVYPIVLGEGATTSGLNLEAAPIQDVQDVDINGQPGVLLQLGTGQAESAWQEVVWEQGNQLLALSATDLSEAELLKIAGTVR
jgi:hypothetical protein